MEKIEVFTQEKGKKLGDLFGIFFEDLNHAADGGLYAQLVQNGSFEFSPLDNPAYHGLTAWEIAEGTKAGVQDEMPLNEKNHHYLHLDIAGSAGIGRVVNNGFNTGIPLKGGEEYLFSCYIRCRAGQVKRLRVSLEDWERNVLATADSGSAGREWGKTELRLYPQTSTWEGRLAVCVEGEGSVDIDMVSLFPRHTFCDRSNGMRKDIAELLAEMKPRFMRFPGGCLVHCGSLDENARNSMYRWKNTIAPVDKRASRRNNWGYNQSLGIGFYEYFQFCEDIGAKPLPVLPGGWNPHDQYAVLLSELQPWVQEALDLIEFANGSEETVWGSIRAKLGHPAPFNMEYLGIGNEEVGEDFFVRFPYFRQAIADKYPDIKVISTSGPNAAGSEYDRGWKSARESGADYVDEHYYQTPEWFLANAHRYDSYREDGPKVFLGEYATWGNTYYNALVEAAYMTGLEKAPAVGLACYAPLLCNADYINWQPDMIWFDNHRVYGTPNYYVQKLFMRNQGDYLLKTQACLSAKTMLSPEPDRICGDIVLASNETTVTYYDICITDDEKGSTETFPECRLTPENQEVFLKRIDSGSYTVRMKAREEEGFKGFQIYFGRKDTDNQMWWQIGGWQNQDTFITEQICGKNSDLSQCLLSVEKGREYLLELRIKGRLIETFVDNKAYHSVDSRPVEADALYYSASEEEHTGDILVKLVNVLDIPRSAQISLIGLAETGSDVTAALYTMDGYGRKDINDFENPDRISYHEQAFRFKGNSFCYDVKPDSISVFRIPVQRRQ